MLQKERQKENMQKKSLCSGEYFFPFPCVEVKLQRSVNHIFLIKKNFWRVAEKCESDEMFALR